MYLCTDGDVTSGIFWWTFNSLQVCVKKNLKNVPELIFFILYFRKDIIKFAWNHLKSDDTIMKHWAYVLVCRFIAAYDTPSKIIFQVIFY